MPSTARLLSSAFVMEPAKVSTPRSTSQSGIDVAMTRTSLAPSSISWRTRCEPRKPVPPVTSVTARWRFSIAARRFVPAVVMRAVRFPGVLVGIPLLTADDADQSRGSDRNLFGYELFLPLAFPELPQRLRVELAACAVAEVYDLVPDACRDQPVRLSPWHALRHLLELLDLEEAPNARTNIATLDERRPFRHCFVGALQIHRQDPNARVQREIPDHGLEVRHDPSHRTRAFRKDECVVTTIEKRLRMT